jgi:cytochrome c553
MAVGALVGGAAVAPAAENERGATVFHNCTHCHGENGGGDQLALAPAIAGLQDWYVKGQLRNFKSGVRGAHPDDRSGLRMYPMSQILKSEEDLDAVAEHVASLPNTMPPTTLEGGNAERGKALYATCATCHGVNGEGNADLNGPNLISTNDWYLVSTLQKYKGGVRGGNPQDQLGALMRSMAGTLVDDQAISDVVAYIMTLR